MTLPYGRKNIIRDSGGWAQIPTLPFTGLLTFDEFHGPLYLSFFHLQNSDANGTPFPDS